MKLAIASDLHFGYAWGTEREEDSFIQGKEAIERSLEADVVILPGDIFDSRVPKQEIIDKAMRIIGLTSSSPSDTKVEAAVPERELPKIVGTPVIAIHGTHERRAKGLTNPVQLLEAAGLCIHLHGEAVVLSKGNEKIAIHGMGGVPEQYALTALNECNFKPIPNMINVLVLHQSFKEYIYDEAAFLSMEDLPDGFDLYINGHVHWSDVKEKKGKTLFHPGSTLLTQMRKIETSVPKRIWFCEPGKKKLYSEDLNSPRKFYYLEIEGTSTDEILDKAREELSKIEESERKPMVKLKLAGELPPGSTLNIKKLTQEFPNLILSIDSSVEAKQFKKKIDLLREAQAKKSVDELGLSILQKNLEQTGYEGPAAHELLPLLAEGKQDEARKAILDK